MLVLLEAVGGTEAGRKIQLRGGHLAVFGRTDHSDYSFPQERALEPRHFQIDCRNGTCMVNALGTAKTIVNGLPIESKSLETGDRIEVGLLAFEVTVEGATQPDAAEPELADEAPAESPTELMSLAALCMFLTLPDDVGTDAQEQQDLESLIGQLTESQKFHPALRLRAHTLSNRQAVWWACLCVDANQAQASYSDEGATALQSARDWSGDPSEDLRRNAEQAAEAAGLDDVPGLIAQAAFCSGGDIGSGLVEQTVEPDERVCGGMVAGALTILGYQVPELAAQQFGEFLRIGKGIMDGGIELPNDTTVT